MSAAYPELLYRYSHHLFSIDPDLHPEWTKTEEVWYFNGREVLPLQEFRVDGDTVPQLPEGFSKNLRNTWDTLAIARTIDEKIGTQLNREPGTVIINRDADGNIIFEGVGLTGRQVDLDAAVRLTLQAIEQGVYDIHLPIIEQQPQITVNDRELRSAGISEVISIGESNFKGSPNNRRHNIATGLAKFNGHIVPQGSIFSFNEVLGPVTAQTGYKPELVILGEKTLPEYGGGLCQVSTTAYRGVWEYGFPIPDRRNHSFAVSYYSPQGTDATIYPPHTDMKFLNDSSGDILIQTYMDGDRAYYIYYGTRDDREAELAGPFVWNRRAPPPDRIEYTTALPPGATKVLGKAVSGMQSAWFRVIRRDTDDEVIEPFYSFYEARPNYTQVGGTPKPPSWIGEM